MYCKMLGESHLPDLSYYAGIFYFFFFFLEADLLLDVYLYMPVIITSVSYSFYASAFRYN